MGILCSIWGCSNDKDDVKAFFGKKGEYVLYRCKRCGKEVIFCSKESKMLDNNERNMKAVELMIGDREFSKQCTIHSAFVKAEQDNLFNTLKQEREKDRIRAKYGLPEGYRQADPLILLEKGLWKPKPSNQGGESKGSNPKPKKESPKKKGGEKPIKLDDGENNDYDNVVKVEIRITNKNDKKPFDENKGGEKYNSWVELGGDGEIHKEELSVDAQISRLERRMNKHVLREEYEKAAKLRDQIFKLKGEK